MKWIKEKATQVQQAIVRVAEGVTEAYIAVKNAAKIVSYVGKTLSFLGDSLKSVVLTIFEPVMNYFDSFRQKIMDFWNSPLVKKVRDAVECIKNLPRTAVKVYRLIAGFIVKVIDIVNFPLGWIRFIVGLICSWEDLMIGIEYLINGVNEINPYKAWNYYGRFLGKLIYIIAMA